MKRPSRKHWCKFIQRYLTSRPDLSMQGRCFTKEFFVSPPYLKINGKNVTGLEDDEV